MNSDKNYLSLGEFNKLLSDMGLNQLVSKQEASTVYKKSQVQMEHPSLGLDYKRFKEALLNLTLTINENKKEALDKRIALTEGDLKQDIFAILD